MINEYKYNQAFKYYQRGQNTHAIDLIKEILSDEPNDAHSHALLSLCLLEQKRVYAAEYEIKLALNIDSSVSMFYSVLARINILKNKPKIALNLCAEALGLDPNSSEVFLLKSKIHQILGDDEQSLNCINSASKVDPDNIDISLAYGNYYFSRGNFNESMKYAQEAISQDPQNIECNILLGQLILKKGNTEEALHLARFAISQDPNSSEALRLFCDIKTSQNLFLGLWWKINSKLSILSPIKASIVLIIMFLFFNLLSQLMKDLDLITLSKIFSYGWLLFVIYSWLGAPMYKRQLNKELKQFRFNNDY